ncbi:hypothetical protein C0Q70_11757 [Pomacea canaliculata]|uniref:Secreted protein n=1 Tax=Pomacea canaliculata TaxID=400727 RepID=A0A2T7P6W0_POMCA|nr:hypothetical protein C0Q70_11757 [Pomacea canaliculata]
MQHRWQPGCSLVSMTSIVCWLPGVRSGGHLDMARVTMRTHLVGGVELRGLGKHAINWTVTMAEESFEERKFKCVVWSRNVY